MERSEMLAALQEIGNVGLGKATSSLSKIVEEYIELDIPVIAIMKPKEQLRMIGNPTEQAIGLLIGFEQDISGVILVILKKEFAFQIMKELLDCNYNGEEDWEKVNEEAISAFQEVANIMAGAYLTAISSYTGFQITTTTSEICIDMIGAILTYPIAQLTHMGQKTICIENSFSAPSLKNTDCKSYIFIFPDQSSLEKLSKALEITDES